MSDQEFEFHFNSLCNKYPSKYEMAHFDTSDSTDEEKEMLKSLIGKWNDRLLWSKPAIVNNMMHHFGEVPVDHDDGVSPIVSEPYEVTKELRKKEKYESIAERYRRKAEFLDLMANYKE